MKLLKPTLIAMSLVTSFASFAESTAIVNTTVYTAGKLGNLENASVVFEDGKIIAINPQEVKADKIIDGKGMILTPGIISAMNQVGLVEVGAVSTSRDGSAKKADMTFDASKAFNPESTIIPFSRKGGITRSVVTPSSWSSTFPGQAFEVLMNSEFDSVVNSGTAVVANFGGSSSDSRATSLNKLVEKLKGQKEKLAKADEKSDEDKKKAKEPSAEEKLLTSLLDGSKPLIADASRATDILHLIDIKKEFGVDVVIGSAKSAAKVKAELAKAEVPVLIQITDNLPGNFDSISASLNTAGELEKAGVKVGIVLGDTHLIYNLRTDAGNAVSYGMSAEGAMNALTSNIADIFNLDAGVIAEGKPADLVLWSGDPLEISTKVNQMWISGEEMSTQSRQDKLRDRYTAKENKPRGYIK